MPKRRKLFIDAKTSILSWEPQLQTRTLLNRCVNTSPFGIQIPTHFSQYYFSQNHYDFNTCPVFCKAKGIIRAAKLRIIRQQRQSSRLFSKVLAKKACKLMWRESTSIGSYLKGFWGGRFINKTESKKDKKNTSLYRAHFRFLFPIGPKFGQ